MNSALTMTCAASVRAADSIADEIEAVYDEITRRAYEVFLARHGEGALDIDDWLMAEREMLIKPLVNVYRAGSRIRIAVDVKHIRDIALEIVIARCTVLIHSLRHPS